MQNHKSTPHTSQRPLSHEPEKRQASRKRICKSQPKASTQAVLPKATHARLPPIPKQDNEYDQNDDDDDDEKDDDNENDNDDNDEKNDEKKNARKAANSVRRQRTQNPSAVTNKLASSPKQHQTQQAKKSKTSNRVQR